MINGKKLINLAILTLFTCCLLFFAFFYPFNNERLNKDSKGKNKSMQEQSVNKELSSKKDFFIEYRMDRERLRSQQSAFLEEILRDPSIDPTTKKEVNERILKLNQIAEEELNIENMVKAKGYQDAVAIVHEGYVDVIIHGSALFSSDVQAIGEIVVKNTGVDMEHVVIMSKP